MLPKVEHETDDKNCKILNFINLLNLVCIGLLQNLESIYMNFFVCFIPHTHHNIIYTFCPFRSFIEIRKLFKCV